MPPKVRATADQVEREYKKKCKREGWIYTPYLKSRLAKKPSNGANRDLTRGK